MDVQEIFSILILVSAKSSFLLFFTLKAARRLKMAISMFQNDIGWFKKVGDIYTWSQHYINICGSQRHCVFSKHFPEAMGLLLGHGLAKTLRAPKMVFSKTLLSTGLDHALPENCLQAIFKIMCDPPPTPTPRNNTPRGAANSQKLYLCLQLWPKRLSWWAWEERELFRNHAWAHDRVEAQEPAGPFPDLSLAQII